MPKAMERKLMSAARKKGLKGDARDAYIYGTMNKMMKEGKMHERKEKK